MITNQETGTRVDEVAAGIYRICTPLDVIPGGFTFNSYLIADDEPLLFHTGYRKLFPITVEAISKVLPVEKLRWIGGSHFEGDEYGALNGLLEAAPEATPFGAEIGVLTSLNDFATRPARGFGDGEEFSIGFEQVAGYAAGESGDLLDDGFQHRKLHRDLDVVCVDARMTTVCTDLRVMKSIELPAAFRAKFESIREAA